MSQKMKVAHLLKKNKKKGVTPLDFPKGFRLSGYILLLRKSGWDINTDRTRFAPCTMATYTLIRAPK
jgi:hypothetical protein